MKMPDVEAVHNVAKAAHAISPLPLELRATDAERVLGDSYVLVEELGITNNILKRRRRQKSASSLLLSAR